MEWNQLCSKLHDIILHNNNLGSIKYSSNVDKIDSHNNDMLNEVISLIQHYFDHLTKWFKFVLFYKILVSWKILSVITRLKMNYLSGKKMLLSNFVLFFLETGGDFWAVRHFTNSNISFSYSFYSETQKNKELYNDSIWWGDFQKQYFFLAHCFYIFLLKAFLKTETIYALSFFYCFGWIYFHQF